MFRPYPVWIGFRYSRARKGKGLLSLVSLFSTLGVSLGVAILILALSVINGSIVTLRDEALKSTPHAVLGGDSLTEQWPALAERLAEQAGVVAVTPNILGDGTLVHQGQTAFVRIRGIDPAREIGALNDPTENDKEVLARLAQTANGIVLSPGLATELGIYGSAELRANALSKLLGRRLSESLGLQVVGIADFGLYGNRGTALLNLPGAAQLFAGETASPLRLRLKVDDPMAVAAVVPAALADLGFSGQASTFTGNGSSYQGELTLETWQQAQASLFRALTIEKYMTGFMLLMIVAVGAVNIVSTLVMAVGDKRADIAILRSMGASRRAIMTAFMAQGMNAGILGTAIGTFFGVALTLNLRPLSLALEGLLAELLGVRVVLLSHLQSVLSLQEVLLIAAMALLISLLATLYPALRASQLKPAETLRHD